MGENSHSFDPTEWAEKRRQAIAKASELREQRRRPMKAPRDNSVDTVRVVRADSRESVSTDGGGVRGTGKKWEIDLKPKSADPRRIPTSRVRAVTSPPEKRRLPPKPHPPPISISRRPIRPPQQPLKVPKRPPPVPVSSRSDPVTRQMIDRDTLRLENRAMFSKAIAYWRSLNPQTVDEEGNQPPRDCRVQVYVRKRPLFDKESFQGREYDVLTVASPKMIVAHNCLFQADLKTPFLMHTSFTCFTHCFSETATSEEVFSQSAQGLVEHTLEGGLSTLICFGQTGSGKTYTMTALQGMISERLFPDGSSLVCQVQFVELCGKKVLDLLSSDKSAVKLRESGDGRLVLDGASVVTVSSASELYGVMETAQDRRNTESTGANDVSSRSHVVGIISLVDFGGKLTLVDLAGSERRKDSMWHDRDRQKEGAEINASIHALKECIRGGGGPATFRLSTLTRILSESFTNPQAKMSVIATVSPCATDIEHSISTLKTVHQLTSFGGVTESRQTDMFPPPKRPDGSELLSLTHPKKWTPLQVQQWLAREGESECYSISKSTTGAMLVRMPESRFIQACGGDEKRGSKLFRSLHARIQQL